MRTKDGVPCFIYPVFRADDVLSSFFGAVSLTAAFYVANKVGASLRENVVDFVATFIAGVVVLAGLRGWGLLRDAGDRRFIERQQREIREEAAARAAADQLQRPT